MIARLNKKVSAVLLTGTVAVFVWGMLPLQQSVRAEEPCDWCYWGDWYYLHTTGQSCRERDLLCWLFESPNVYKLCDNERWRRECYWYQVLCAWQEETRYPKVGCCWKP